MTTFKLILAAAAAAAPLAMAGAASAQPARTLPACAAASFKAPANATITAVKAFGGAAPYCRVDGYVTTTNPGPNKVRFMVALPQTWAGRYLFTVQGGAAGFVVDPTQQHLAKGYAVASTDKGVRTSHILDFSFRADPAQSLDWGHRGVHVAALATQALTRDYYRQPKIHRYVMGCSGGGDGSLTEAEKYPTDFDAFLPGAMTYNVFIGVFWGKLAQHVNRDPAAWISPEELKRVGQVVMKENDGSDGAIDGLSWDPTRVKGDPPRGGELPGRPEGGDLRHRRHEPPTARAPRRPDQPRFRHQVPGHADRRSGDPGCRPPPRLRARSRFGRHRTRHARSEERST